MSTEQKSSGRRVLQGRVVSDKMDKTVTVEVTRRVRHETYGKTMTRAKRYKAHDEAGTCKVDDVVTIEECRPLSATKRWRVVGAASAGTGE